MTEKGGVVRGLDATRFRATFRKQPVQILSVVESPPHRVVLLFDTSASMMGQNQTPLLLIAEEILGSTPPDVALAFLTFSRAVETETRLDVSRSAARTELRKLETVPWDVNAPRAFRKTALFDAIMEALRLLEPTQPGDSVVIISDGGENASKTGWGDLRRAVGRSGVRVFSLLTAQSLASRTRTPEEQLGPGEASALAEETGGDYWAYDMDDFKWLTRAWLVAHRAGTGQELTPLLGPAHEVSSELTEWYSLKIRVPELVDKPHGWNLAVVDPQTGKPDRHLVLHYPRRLLPATSGGR